MRFCLPLNSYKPLSVFGLNPAGFSLGYHEYGASGHLAIDRYRNATFRTGALGLPVEAVVFGAGGLPSGTTVQQVESGNVAGTPQYSMEMAYDEGGLRVWRTVRDVSAGTARTEVTVPGVGVYVQEDGGAWTLARLELAEGGYRSAGGEALFSVRDAQGSVRGYARQGGGLVAAYGYTPYGMIHELKEDAGTDRSRWQGKEWDGEYGKYYFGARYFDPLFGLWTSPDPAGQYADPYSYGGDPANMVDPTGLWSIGAGITLGWDSDRGFNVGLGFSHEMDQGTMSGFGSSNMGYTWHEDGTRSVNMTSSGGVNLYGWNLYTGGGYSWNSEGGRVIGAYTGANYMGFAGGETGGSAYFDEDWDYQGYTVRQEFYGGAGGARVYSGYEWGFDGMEGRGAYGGASALGANVEFAQNGGLSYGGKFEMSSIPKLINEYDQMTSDLTNPEVLGRLTLGQQIEGEVYAEEESMSDGVRARIPIAGIEPYVGEGRVMMSERPGDVLKYCYQINPNTYIDVAYEKQGVKIVFNNPILVTHSKVSWLPIWPIQVKSVFYNPGARTGTVYYEVFSISARYHFSR